MAIDYTTDIGKVRLLIGDTDEAALGFTDAQIQGFLDLSGEGPTIGACFALESMASRYSRMSKVKIMDVEVDGSIAAKDLRLLAAQMRKEFYDNPDFDIAKMITGPSSFREDVRNEFLQREPIL